MGFIIEDAHNSGGKLKVDLRGRAHADVIVRTKADLMTKLGKMFGASIEELTLTTAGLSGALYLKNFRAEDLVIPPKGLRIVSGTATGPATTGLAARIQLLKNITGGTVISGNPFTNDLQNQNPKISTNEVATPSAVGADASLEMGAEGSSFVGDVFYASGISDVGIWENSSEIRLGQGGTLVLALAPPLGTTSQLFSIALQYYRDVIEASQVEN